MACVCSNELGPRDVDIQVVSGERAAKLEEQYEVYLSG